MNTHQYTWKGLVKVGIVFCVLLCVFSLPYRKYRDMGYQYEDIASKVAVFNEETNNFLLQYICLKYRYYHSSRFQLKALTSIHFRNTL